jgi:predicted TIM-barrel fold metal-dependent hydrolase
MDKAVIEGALVWHVAQRDADPLTGNDLLARAIEPYERLYGAWALLPPQTGELPDLVDWLAAAKAKRVRAFTAWPERNRFLLRAEVMGPVLEEMTARRIPFMFRCGSQEGPDNWSQAYDLLKDFPDLTVVLCNVGCWGPDRLFRPLLDRYPNAYVETSEYILDGGIESFVARYGGGRLLFGSDFPSAYHGAMMLALAHSDISQADKEAIAAGNMARLLNGVKM